MTEADRQNERSGIPLSPSPRQNSLVNGIALASLILIVLGGKFLLIHNYGSIVPFWDQWDGEASILYKPYLESNLSIASLFSSHNEHRILLTRILSLLLLELDGGWNPLFQMIVDALLHITAILILTVSIFKIIDMPSRAIFTAFTALVFAVPIGFENSLCGFQSEFYFVEIFSFLAIIALISARAFTPSWWGGVVFSILAYFSMASGVLTVAAALLVIACQIALRLRWERKETMACAILIALLTVMLIFVNHVKGHDELGAHTLGKFAEAFLTFLAYPFGLIGIIFCFPMIIYGMFVVRTRPNLSSPHWIILGLILWLFAQAASIAYGRATGVTASRYLDLALVGLPLNFGILLFGLRRGFDDHRKYQIALVVAGIWLTLTTTQLISKVFKTTMPDVRLRYEFSLQQEDNVKKYLAGDQTALRGKPWLTIPYPISDRLEMLLSDSTIKLALPEGLFSEKKYDDFDKHTILKGHTRNAVRRLTSHVLEHAHDFLAIGISLAFLTILLCLEWTRILILKPGQVSRADS